MTATIKVSKKLTKTSFSFLLLLLICKAQASTLSDAPYTIKGYKKESRSEKEHVIIKSEEAKGLGEMSFEKLFNADILIENKKISLRMTSKEALFKNNEIVLTKGAKVVMKGLGTSGFILESRPPEELIYIEWDSGQIRAPSSQFSENGKRRTGRSVLIDLDSRSATWVQPVKDEKGRSLKAPSLLKF